MRNLIKQILTEIEVPHHYQPTGNSCGPSCLKMVHDFFVGDRFDVPNICQACSTDWVVGTPPERMVKGLNYMGIQYIEHINDEDPFQALKDAIDKGHPCIVRTITQGTPHWIIAVDYDHDTFMINDPWLGRIIYDADELNAIWHMREYFFYEVTGADKTFYPEEFEEEETEDDDDGEDYMEDKPLSETVEISHFNSEEEIVEALRVGLKVFKGQMPPKSLLTYLSKAADWSVSVKATYQGKVVGFYLLTENQMYDYILHYMMRDYNCYSVKDCETKNPGSIRVNPMDFKSLDGVEGVALGVDPDYKGLGVGKKLLEYSQRLPYDYIWGQQYESLGNIEHWTKRREIAAYFPGLWLTYAFL